MTTITHDTLRELAGFMGEPCISIYLPTHYAGHEIQLDQLELKNLLREAEPALHDMGVSPKIVIDNILGTEAPAAEEEPWHGDHRGRAIFIAPGFFRSYSVVVPLRPTVVVGKQFYLLPVLPLIGGEDRYFLLVLSLNGTRLFEGTDQSLRQVAMPGLQVNLKEYLEQFDRERQLQLHGGGRPGGTWEGLRRGGIFHGSGDAREHRKEDLEEYFRMLEREVRGRIGSGSAPLLLAGVSYLLPIYRSVSDCRILEQEIRGNLDLLSRRELHEASWQLVRPWFQRDQVAALEKFHNLMGTGLASSTPSEVVPAAGVGRVEALFIADGHNGSELPQHVTESEALANLAAIETTINGGAIYCVDPDVLGDGADLAAVFRY